MTDNKKRYCEWIRESTDIPLFFQPWYLDAVSQNGAWDVVLSADRTNQIRGVLPFFTKKKYGIRYITMPILTPYLGLWIEYPSKNLKNTTKNQLEKKIYTELIGKLPKSLLIKIHSHPDIQNLLPFIWANYHVQVRYTYCLSKLSQQELWEELDGKQRNIISKAQNSIEIYESDDVNHFYKLNKSSFERNKTIIPYSLEFLQNLDDSLQKHNRRMILLAKKNDNEIHAGAYIVFDREYAYCLAIGVNSKFKNSGGAALVIWEAILKSFSRVDHFNFEGGMIPNIERFFRSFGGQLVPYYSMYKAQNRLLYSVLDLLKKV